MCSGSSPEGELAERKAEAVPQARQVGGSGRSTVDGGEGNESTGGKAPTDGKLR
jgi:hypothetical protein